MKFAWIDIRSVAPAHVPAVVDAAVHARLDGIVDSRPDVLATLPPTVKKVLLPSATAAAGSSEDAKARKNKGADAKSADTPTPSPADLIAVTVTTDDELNDLRLKFLSGEKQATAFVEVIDQRTLDLACAAASVLPYTVVKFRDPTKIPLEIVIAAADRSEGQLICEVTSLEEAEIVVGVLEKGSEGLMMAPKTADDVFKLAELLASRTAPLDLTTLTVESIEHSGMGDRVCVDTCTHFEKDEGILVGSYAHGFVLCVSETHPLPYMPTRPFRVNAGALHSYTYGADNRTNYLSELHAGATVLGVGADGRTRRIAVGRVKLESRPLLTIKAKSPEGVEVSLTVQDDWHVRVLGPGAAVLNVTELKKGDQLLGYTPTDKRHVGWPVGEFCIEK
ncbi:3-dehydroquinate synthase II family protein [Streptomyces sp. NPDC001903]|uniref:3-dehydroquinate synthase II family protein n=1 Tax=Streptomyces sp. NPDC001903 TaxID=3364622 RepID=UPI0036AD7AD6